MGFAQDLCGKHGVEDVGGAKLVSLPEQSQVVVGPMENQGLHGACLEQGGQIQAAEGVYDIMVVANGDLNKAKACCVVIHGVSLGVHRGHVIILQVQ